MANGGLGRSVYSDLPISTQLICLMVHCIEVAGCKSGVAAITNSVSMRATIHACVRKKMQDEAANDDRRPLSSCLAVETAMPEEAHV
eukprot:304775-Pleurochrysis_carterae.AAC.2